MGGVKKMWIQFWRSVRVYFLLQWYSNICSSFLFTHISNFILKLKLKKKFMRKQWPTYLFYPTCRDIFYIMKYTFDANKTISETKIIVMLISLLVTYLLPLKDVFLANNRHTSWKQLCSFLTSCSIIHMILTLYSGFAGKSNDCFTILKLHVPI